MLAPSTGQKATAGNGAGCDACQPLAGSPG